MQFALTNFLGLISLCKTPLLSFLLQDRIQSFLKHALILKGVHKAKNQTKCQQQVTYILPPRHGTGKEFPKVTSALEQ